MALSPKDRMALLPREEREAWLASQPDWIVEEIARDEWWWTARPEQIPPAGPWSVALALAGRGWGKSKSGAEWTVERLHRYPTDKHGVPVEFLVIAETLSDARLICLEGPAGILRVLKRRGIKYNYIKSPRPIITLDSGAKIYCEGADDSDVGRGYNASGAWLDEMCVAAGEPIVTRRGAIPVETVTTADEVWTRDGWRQVTHAGITRAGTEVWEVTTGAGTVRLTPDHRVWTSRGWLEVSALRNGDTMWTCLPNRPYPAKPPRSTCGTGKSGTTTSALGTTTTATARSCTEACGPPPTAPSPTVTRSTTSTTSAGMCDWRTWSGSPSTTTGPSTPGNVTTRPGPPATHRRLSLDAFGSTGSAGNPGRSPAANASAPSSPPVCAPRCAPRNAAPLTVGPMRPVAVNSVAKVAAPADVYDITVAGTPEFFAGGGMLLVHNCKWKAPRASWYEGIMPSLRADLPGDHPRAFVTTTPKPVDILREWLNRKDGSVHLMRGSTFDNAGNLSSVVVEELRKRYEGTTLGRQELDGEMLELSDGALFKRADLERHRVDEVPDDLVQVVVGVDPSLTGEDDEMGVVVVGRTRDYQLWVLGDHSLMAVGRDAALHCWKVVAEYGADLLVYESNLGKRWMETVLRDAYMELVEAGLFEQHTTPPMRAIDVKTGKKTRAEPVAMRSEQGRLHMVGPPPSTSQELPALWRQLTEFTGWDIKESPDRLDAMVHAARWCMLAEKRRTKIASPADLSSTLQDLWAQTASW